LLSRKKQKQNEAEEEKSAHLAIETIGETIKKKEGRLRTVEVRRIQLVRVERVEPLPEGSPLSRVLLAEVAGNS
jgi:hypothetical protein